MITSSLKIRKKWIPLSITGSSAGVEAIRDAGLEVTEENAERIGVLMGSGIGGLDTIERNYNAYLNGGPRRFLLLCPCKYYQHGGG